MIKILFDILAVSAATIGAYLLGTSSDMILVIGLLTLIYMDIPTDSNNKRKVK